MKSKRAVGQDAPLWAVHATHKPAAGVWFPQRDVSTGNLYRFQSANSICCRNRPLTPRTDTDPYKNEVEIQMADDFRKKAVRTGSVS